ncbi:MAG: sigma-54-dependent Fis family transcriptional regulator [Porticoccus sp.]|nr:MAG: sigma-54-dependent Fis family transcriptional regulator [Porticoccus sp.]
MSSATRVLVVEDDAALRDAMCDTIQYGGYQVLSASNGEEALWCLKRERVDLIVSDVQMDVMDGNTLLREAKALRPELPFVLVTAYGSIENAVKAMQEGAADYLLKPFEAEVLLEMVSRLARPPEVASDGMVAEDPKTRQLCELARRVAATQATVLISGESGTGKEVIARYIHRHSPRAEKPFLAINCAAIPETMLESMLFGYEKGAYTGAHQSRAGKFEQANGGTLLLDEVSEMDLGLQAKLLRVLQEKEVERLGGNTLISLDVRVLATTNRNLREEVASGRFREDLYYRLNIFTIKLPGLRERIEDLPLLIDYFTERLCEQYQLSINQQDFCNALLPSFRLFEWPGNVRQLENVLERLVVSYSLYGNISHFKEALPRLVPEIFNSLHSVGSNTEESHGHLQQLEHEEIARALERFSGNKTQTAEYLGISQTTLWRRLKQMSH